MGWFYFEVTDTYDYLPLRQLMEFIAAQVKV